MGTLLIACVPAYATIGLAMVAALWLA